MPYLPAIRLLIIPNLDLRCITEEKKKEVSEICLPGFQEAAASHTLGKGTTALPPPNLFVTSSSILEVVH